MLEQLFLWRHAHALAGEPDLQRTLSETGHQQAGQMASWLARRCPSDAKLVCSPATRSQQTGAALVRVAPFLIQTYTGIQPGASSADVLKWLSGEPFQARCMVVVGHQPWMGQVIAGLLTGQATELSVKKASVWYLERNLQSGEWALRGVQGAQWLDF